MFYFTLFSEQQVGGCTNIHAMTYRIRSYAFAKKYSSSVCNTFETKCENIAKKGHRSLIKLTCGKGYEVNYDGHLTYCKFCVGKNLDYPTQFTQCNSL